MDWSIINCYYIRSQSYPEHHHLRVTRIYYKRVLQNEGYSDIIGDHRLRLFHFVGSYHVPYRQDFKK